MSLQTQVFVGGEWVDGESRRPVLDPATGDVVAEVEMAGAELCRRAVDAAAAAQPDWATTPPRVRAEILRRAFEIMTMDAEAIARLITRENGKVLADARGEVAYAAEFFRWFSEEASRLQGDYRQAPAGDKRILVAHQPVGVSLLITPWNFPAAMATRKFAPALAAGCTTILKPSSETPLTALAVAEVLDRAGVPAGVVNVVVASARRRGRGCRGGGRDGGEAAQRRCGLHSGEPVLRAPLGRRRIHLKLADRMAALRLGPGLDADSEIASLVSVEERDKVAALVEAAVAAGARAVTGGVTPDGPGAFYPATVLADVRADADVLAHEIFGPVAPVVVVDSDEEAVRLANDTPYGLISYVYAADLRRGLQVAEAIESGMVALNRGALSDPAAPFGGWKQSGLGREGGFAGIHEFLETKYIALDV